MKGKMIVFEGNNGAGKSTQLELARQHLHATGYRVLVTREPGGTPMAEKIRSLLLSTDTDSDTLSITAEILLFFAARAQHLEKRLIPALEDGCIVLCDRFTSATIAFQCLAQDFPLDRMRRIKDAALGSFEPDLTLIFDIDTSEGLQRSSVPGNDDRIETIALHQLERAREGFLWQAREQSDAFSVIDASRPVTEVFLDVQRNIDELLAGTQLRDGQAQ